jgi:predicted ATPase
LGPRSRFGREFSYRLLAAVASPDDRSLQAALSHIAACQLILVRGEPPNSTYMFKHALVRDAAYATMVRSKRQQLHSRIADVLMMEFRDTVETQPELMAYHLAQAGLTEKAIAHLRKAQPGPRQESRPSSAGGAMDEVAFERKVAEAHVSADLRL